MPCVMYTDSGKKRELHFKHILTGKITRNRPSRDVLKSMQRRIEKEKRRVERTKNMVYCNNTCIYETQERRLLKRIFFNGSYQG